MKIDIHTCAHGETDPKPSEILFEILRPYQTVQPDQLFI